MAFKLGKRCSVPISPKRPSSLRSAPNPINCSSEGKKFNDKIRKEDAKACSSEINLFKVQYNSGVQKIISECTKLFTWRFMGYSCERP